MTGMRRTAGLLLCALAAAVVVLVAGAGPAAAHATLLETVPADQSELDAAPDTVTFRFTEGVELSDEENVKVVDAAGERVDAGLVGEVSDEVVLDLPDDLPDGTYVATFVVVSGDGHLVRGASTFAVGTAIGDVDVSALTAGGSGGGYEPAAAVGRFVLYVAVLLAAGGVLFLAAVVRRDQPEGSLARIVTVAGAVAVVATLYGWAVQAVQSSPEGLGALFSPGALLDVAGQPYGRSAAVRFLGLALLLAATARRGRPAWSTPVALIGAALTLGSFVLAGHTASTEPRWLVVGSDLVHTSAAAAWFGGLTLLAVAMRSRRLEDDVEGAGRLLARFSLVAGVSVAAVGAAGVALSWAEVRTVEGLTTTPYGLALMAKVGIVLGMVAVGAYNNRLLVPALATRSVGAAWTSLRRMVNFEVIGLVVALSVTAVLVNLVPPRSAVATSEGPFQAVEELDEDTDVELLVDPAAPGSNRVHVSLLDGAGRPIEDQPEEVTLSLSHEEAAVGPIERSLEPMSAAHFTAELNDLAIVGEWTVEVEVLVDEFTAERATFTVPIG